MAIVGLNIGGRDIQLVCGDGEEQRLLELAKDLNGRIKSLANIYEGSNDKVLLVMTALMMQDEINELTKNTANIQEINQKNNVNSQYINQVSGKINLLSEYVENLAGKLEKC